MKKINFLLSLCCFLLIAAVKAQAFVPSFNKVAPLIVKNKTKPQLVIVNRVIKSYDQQQNIIRQVSEKLSYTASGHFLLERYAKSGKRTLLWNGRQGIDLLENKGYCQHNKLRLEPLEKLFTAASLADLWALTEKLKVETKLAGMAAGDNNFYYSYGALREDEKRNQLLVGQTKYRITGYLTYRRQNGQLVAYKYLFKNYRSYGEGISYPQKIEIYRQGKLTRTVETKKFTTSKTIPATLFSSTKLIKNNKQRSSCALSGQHEKSLGADPENLLRDLDSRFGGTKD